MISSGSSDIPDCFFFIRFLICALFCFAAAALELHRCPSLVYADLRYNKIADKLLDLAKVIIVLLRHFLSQTHSKCVQTIDSWPAIVIVALKGNPCIRSSQDRLYLLGAMNRLREVFFIVIKPLHRP